MQSSVHDMDHSLLILTNAELIPDCQIEGKVGINWCYVGNEISCATIGGEPPIEVTPEDKDYYKGALGLDDRGALGPLFEDPAAVLICQTSAQWSFEGNDEVAYGFAPMCHICVFYKDTLTIRAFYMAGCKDSVRKRGCCVIVTRFWRQM